MALERRFRMHDGKRGAALAVRITPRASRNEITEIMDNGTVKIRLTAPPVEGKANEALITFLAFCFGNQSLKDRDCRRCNRKGKLVTVMDLTPEEVHQKIISSLA